MSKRIEEIDHYPIPKGLLRAAKIDSDEAWDALKPLGVQVPDDGDVSVSKAIRKEALEEGSDEEVEEHGVKRKLARKLARDHLKLDPNYYNRTKGKVKKALPQSGKEQPVKKAPKGSKATSKKQGSGASKPRYNYADEKKEGKKVGKHAKLKDGEEKPPEPPESQGQPPKPEPEPEEPKHVDVSKLAGVLQTSIGVLRKTAMKFAGNPKMKGRKGFVDFMQTRCARFAKKHKLSDKYFGLAYDALVAQAS